MISNLCTPMGGPPPKNLGKFFFTPLGWGMVKTFPSNRPWKGVSKTSFKILGVPPNKFAGGKVSPNLGLTPKFHDFPTFSLISPQWSEVSPSWKSIMRLPYDMVRKWCTLVHHEICDYLIAANAHPPYGWRYSDSTKQHRLNLPVW